MPHFTWLRRGATLATILALLASCQSAPVPITSQTQAPVSVEGAVKKAGPVYRIQASYNPVSSFYANGWPEQGWVLVSVAHTSSLYGIVEHFEGITWYAYESPDHETYGDFYIAFRSDPRIDPSWTYQPQDGASPSPSTIVSEPGSSPTPSNPPSSAPSVAPSEWPSPSPEPSTSTPPTAPEQSPKTNELTYYVLECGDNEPDPPQGPNKYSVQALQDNGGACGTDLTPEQQRQLAEGMQDVGVVFANNAWEFYNSPAGQVSMLFVDAATMGKAATLTKLAAVPLIVQRASQTARITHKGKLGEEAVRRYLGSWITDEQLFVRAAFYGGTKNRYLDFVTRNAVVEVKNVQILYASGQLKAVCEIARKKGLVPIIYTDAKYVTPQLQALLKSYGGKIEPIPWEYLLF